MKHILQVWRDDGVPANVPLMVTESHVSWSLTGPMTTIFGALWLADNIGSFFEGGGAAFYHSPIQPQGVQNTDRKSTRLNSSHLGISYAVFCFKKKKKLIAVCWSMMR